MVSEDAPKLAEIVTLDTGPERGTTHWGQQIFYFQDAIRIKTDLKQASGSLPEGEISGRTTTVHLKGKLGMFRNKNNARLYRCNIEHFLEEVENESQNMARTTNSVENNFFIS